MVQNLHIPGIGSTKTASENNLISESRKETENDTAKEPRNKQELMTFNINMFDCTCN